LVDTDGAIRGGNGRVDYAIKGVHKHEGPVAGLPEMNMQVMIVDGNAAANVREAKAYVSSMRAVLSGLDIVEKDMDNPELLSFNVIQVSNIMNAANRVREQFNETFKTREKDHQEFIKKTKKEMPEDKRTKWVSQFTEVERLYRGRTTRGRSR
jgi:hypothetical protein